MPETQETYQDYKIAFGKTDKKRKFKPKNEPKAKFNLQEEYFYSCCFRIYRIDIQITTTND